MKENELKESLVKSMKYLMRESIGFFKWTIPTFLAILISNYLITQLKIVNIFIINILIASIISITIQAIGSHYEEFYFKTKWFFFYFLIYAVTLTFLREYLLNKFNVIPSTIILAIIISGIILLIKKIRLRSYTIPWISFIFLLLLIVSNLMPIQNLVQTNLNLGFDNSQNINSNNNQIITENKKSCPTPNSLGNLAFESDFKLNQNYQIPFLNNLIDSSIWRVEHDFSPCYKGKYKGQYPNWVYCDNLIVSRWEIGSSGTINYRWYTGVSAEWRPQENESDRYFFNGFSCENGQKVTVVKGTTNYYVYNTKDGSAIRIAY
jgi:hypothetical protein